MGWLDENGLVYLWNKIKTALSGKVDKVSGKGLSTNDYTSAEKTKLAGIATGANKYTHPAYTAKTSGLYKVTVDGTGHVSGTAAVTKADITALGIPGQDTNTTYGNFVGSTTSAEGKSGLVPAPPMTIGVGTEKFLCEDGTWKPTPNNMIPIASAEQNGLMCKEDKFKIDNLLLHEIDAELRYAKKSDITNMYRFKGSVTDPSKLPTTGQTAGDVYNIEAASTYGPAGQNVAWTGSAWDNLGGIFTLTAITNAQIDSICV